MEKSSPICFLKTFQRTGIRLPSKSSFPRTLIPSLSTRIRTFWSNSTLHGKFRIPLLIFLILILNIFSFKLGADIASSWSPFTTNLVRSTRTMKASSSLRWILLLTSWSTQRSNLSLQSSFTRRETTRYFGCF